MNKGNIIINNGRMVGSVSQVSHENVYQSKENDLGGCSMHSNYKYDIAISYASEQEHYVYRVARILEQENLKVFYAPNREEEFLGKDMITEFYSIYRYESAYVACFISTDYLKKDITMHEAKTALLRGKDEGRNYLIPIYFGGVRLDGLNPDIQFMNADKLREVEVADKLKTIAASFGKE